MTKVGDCIYVKICGGSAGVVLTGSGGASISIPPGGAMAVHGTIVGDLNQHWEVELAMSVGGANRVRVLKSEELPTPVEKS